MFVFKVGKAKGLSRYFWAYNFCCSNSHSMPMDEGFRAKQIWLWMCVLFAVTVWASYLTSLNLCVFICTWECCVAWSSDSFRHALQWASGKAWWGRKASHEKQETLSGWTFRGWNWAKAWKCGLFSRAHQLFSKSWLLESASLPSQLLHPPPKCLVSVSQLLLAHILTYFCPQLTQACHCFFL